MSYRKLLILHPYGNTPVMAHHIDKKSIERELTVCCEMFKPQSRHFADLVKIALLNPLHRELSRQDDTVNLEEISEHDLNQNSPMWLTKAFNEGQPVYKFLPGLHMKEDIQYVLNWIETAVDRRASWLEETDKQGRPLKLLKIGSLEQAKRAADKDMHAEAQRQAANPRIEDSMHEKTVMRFDNGFRIVQMLTSDALDYESKHVGHCVGDGGYDDQLRNGVCEFYSLRDPFNKGHATMQIRVGEHSIVECKGKSNSPPISKYMPYIKQFLTERQYTPKAMPANIGLIEQDGIFYDITDLPEGFHYRDDLILSEAMIESLPKGMRVDGYLYIMSTPLTELPEDLYVGGSLSLRDTKIKKLPSGLVVKGHLDLFNSVVEELPENFRTEGGLNLCGSKIRSLPERLYVGGDFNAHGLPISALPTEFYFGGDINLNQTQVTALPKGMVVKGRLDLYNAPIAELPEGLEVGADLNLSDTLIEELPSGLKVGGALFLSNTKITRYPEHVWFGGGISLDGCEITELPEDLYVNGLLNISRTKITSLPKGMRVDGDLYAQYTELTALPDDIIVSNNYQLEGSKIESLPENLRVLGSLMLNKTKVRNLPEGLHVANYLDVRETQVKSLPDDITFSYISLPGSDEWKKKEEAREWLAERERGRTIADNQARILNRILSDLENENEDQPLAAPFIIRPR